MTARQSANQSRHALPAGLDPARVAAHLPSARGRFTQASTVVARHLHTHGGYVSWSGGKDSTAAVHLAASAVPDVPVVWFDSGLEFPDTRPYLTTLASRWNLNFHIITAVPDALSIMEASGAWDHDALPGWDAPDLHDALVTRPARQARARFGPAEVWGLRAAESAGRRALLAPGQGTFTRADGTVVCSPIWSWRDVDVAAYLASHDIPLNPAYDRLRAAGATGKDLRVGLALDGNNLNFGRVVWLRRCYPDLYRQIEDRLPRLREWA